MAKGVNLNKVEKCLDRVLENLNWDEIEVLIKRLEHVIIEREK